jgi:hypothetical protein
VFEDVTIKVHDVHPTRLHYSEVHWLYVRNDLTSISESRVLRLLALKFNIVESATLCAPSHSSTTTSFRALRIQEKINDTVSFQFIIPPAQKNLRSNSSSMISKVTPWGLD